MNPLLVGGIAFIIGLGIGEIVGWNMCRDATEEREKMLRILDRAALTAKKEW